MTGNAIPGINNQMLITGLALAAILWVMSIRGVSVKVGETVTPISSPPNPRTTIEPEEVMRIVGFQASGDPLLSQPLLLAIIETESNFRIRAEGLAGEIGLMQIMPVTWEDTIKRANLKPEVIGQDKLDPYNPRDNIRVGIAFLKLVIKELTQKLNRQPNISELLTAYNVGVAGSLKGKTNTVYVEKIRTRTKKWVEYLQQKENRFNLPTGTNAINEL